MRHHPEHRLVVRPLIGELERGQGLPAARLGDVDTDLSSSRITLVGREPLDSVKRHTTAKDAVRAGFPVPGRSAF